MKTGKELALNVSDALPVIKPKKLFFFLSTTPSWI